MSYQKRPDKFDKITKHAASRADDLGHFIIGPFDKCSADADLKWGVGRLAELVTPETAVIWARTMANMNEAIRACYDPEDEDKALANLKACVESGIKGLAFMDAEAERTGQTKANTRILEFDLDGFKLGVMADDTAWPAIKQQRPNLKLFSMREVAVALKLISENPTIAAVKEVFPDAKVTRIKPNPPVDYAGGGDEIPF